MAKVKFRIIKKTKNDVTLKMANKKLVTYTWDEFNNVYKIEDLYWATIRDDKKELYEETNKKINDLCVALVLSQGEQDSTLKGVHLLQIADLTEELTKSLNCTPAELINLVKKRLALVGWNAPKKKLVEDPKPTTTFGDLPALQELKAKMNKNDENK